MDLKKKELYTESTKPLNGFQRSVFQECLVKRKCGVSLPLGSGKTLLSLCLANYFTRLDQAEWDLSNDFQMAEETTSSLLAEQLLGNDDDQSSRTDVVMTNVEDNDKQPLVSEIESSSSSSGHR